MDLTLRPTVIAGDKLENDYCVIHDGRGVGRIRPARRAGITGHGLGLERNPSLPIPTWCNGSADSLEAAKDQFKAAWDRFYATLAPADI